MPTPEILNKHPPFPDHVPTCHPPRLSYGRLLAADTAESSKLFHACTDTGFFLLDLRGTLKGEELINDAEGVLELNREVSALDILEKSRYRTRRPQFLFGWKGFGATKIENGRGDRCEFYSVSRDGVLGIGAPPAHPVPIERCKPLLKSFILHAHDACTLILSHIDMHLGLPCGTLAAFHQTPMPSMTTVRLIHMPPQPAKDRQASLFGHTDNGTITILFNVVGGLQILPRGFANEEQNWRWIRPVPGCAIVFLGDTLVQWTGGAMSSIMHRVMNPPGLQAECERYSFGYVLKPNNQASMRTLVGANAMQQEDEDDQYAYQDWLMVKGAASREGKNLVRISGTPKPR